jgi:hypothetical protein
MKTLEDKMISALFRARSISENKSDPGPDWEEPNLLVNIIRYFAIGFVFYCFLAS